MTPIEFEPVLVNDRAIHVHYSEPSPARHAFEAAAVAESDGGFSVYALHYPDVFSQGDTLAEAKANIADAFQLMLETRRSFGEPLGYSSIPVIDSSKGNRFRVTVNGQ